MSTGDRTERGAEGPGVVVRKVVPDSSADQAGLLAGDRVLAVDGRELRHFADLVHTVKQHHWGQCLRVHLRRDGEGQTRSVVLKAPQGD